MITQTETPKIELYDILADLASQGLFRVRNPFRLVTLFDTGGVKGLATKDREVLFSHRMYNEQEHRLAITWRVRKEILRKKAQGVIARAPAHFIFRNSKVVYPVVSQENLALISKSYDEILEKRGRLSVEEGVDWTDVEMISYAMDRARQRDQTLIITQDNRHIRRVVNYLRANALESQIFTENMFAVGMRGALRRDYPYSSN